MQPSIGKKYQSRNSLSNLCVFKNSANGCVNTASSLASAIRVQSWLKRKTSRSMRQKRGLKRLLRCANTVAKFAPLHSSAPPSQPAFGTCTEKDISVHTVGTVKLASSEISAG